MRAPPFGVFPNIHSLFVFKMVPMGSLERWQVENHFEIVLHENPISCPGNELGQISDFLPSWQTIILPLLISKYGNLPQISMDQILVSKSHCELECLGANKGRFL